MRLVHWYKLDRWQPHERSTTGSRNARHAQRYSALLHVKIMHSSTNVEVLNSMHLPETVDELCEFVHFCRWIESAIPNFEREVAPLVATLEEAYAKSERRITHCIRTIQGVLGPTKAQSIHNKSKPPTQGCAACVLAPKNGKSRVHGRLKQSLVGRGDAN